MPKKVWTEKKALKLVEELVDWLVDKDENYLFNKFLFIEKAKSGQKLYPKVLSYLEKKYESVAKEMSLARAIQEVKLAEKLAQKGMSHSGIIFQLKHNHQWKDDQTHIIEDKTAKFKPLKPEEKRPMTDLLAEIKDMVEAKKRKN